MLVEMDCTTHHTHIIMDRGGWGNYVRLTCTHCESDGNTLLQKKWWKQKDRDNAYQRFLLDHRGCKN